MIATVARRAVAVLVALAPRQDPLDQLGQVLLRARSELHERQAGGGVRSEEVEEAVTLAPAEPLDVGGEVRDETAARFDP